MWFFVFGEMWFSREQKKNVVAPVARRVQKYVFQLVSADQQYFGSETESIRKICHSTGEIPKCKLAEHLKNVFSLKIYL